LDAVDETVLGKNVGDDDQLRAGADAAVPLQVLDRILNRDIRIAEKVIR